MNTLNLTRRQNGVALVVSLLFLVVVTIISIAAATNSSQGLKMSANMQDSYNSFQSAEAGIFATMALVDTADEPFTRQTVLEPFAMMTSHPLSNLRDGRSCDGTSCDGTSFVDTKVFLTAAGRECPRPPGGTGGSSIGLFDCDYYRIESEHDVPSRARTKIQLGVVKTVIGNNG